MFCCGQDVRTNFCGRCGQKNGEADPLYGLYEHCVQTAGRLRSESRMWQEWADALRPLAYPPPAEPDRTDLGAADDRPLGPDSPLYRQGG